MLVQPPARLFPAVPGTIRTNPASVVRALAEMLCQRGIRRVYSASCDVFGVVSVNTDLTVWTNGRVLLWHYGGAPDACPAADLEGAAERLATLAAQIGSPDTG